MSPHRPLSRRTRDLLLFGVPALAVLALLMLPLITGSGTLILRDVLQVHLMLKIPLVRAFEAGAFPLIDPGRLGGQPLAGNPNALPFYPDNLLFLVAPLFWAFNAHFWIHLLLAPVAAYWMARAWGLSRPSSWAAGVCFGSSGYMLSQLNLYNLIAGAALVPALVAAVLRAVETAEEERPSRWTPAAAGLIWALLLVSGEPLMALLGAALAGSALLVRHGGRPPARPAAVLAAALAFGTCLGLPQIVELLRILPTSYRGVAGYASWGSTVAAWQPAQALEWLVPLAFGRVDRLGAGGFWGVGFFAGKLPLFLSLSPGLLALGLVVASGRPRSRAAWWAWGWVAAGLFLAMGGYNPAARWLFKLPGAGLFRYPVKLWPLVAAGAALLCAIGFERTVGAALAGEGRVRLRPLAIVLAVLGATLGGVWLVLVLAPARFDAIILALAPKDWTPFLAAAERARWLATTVASVGVAAALLAAVGLCRTRPLAGAALLLAVHAAGQAYLLRSLAVTDDAALYRVAPPALRAVPADAVVAHGEYLGLFGRSPRAVGPDNRAQWIIRQDHQALYPFSGVLQGLRYDLDRSPEGLESYLGRLATGLVRRAPDDATRLRALSRWGIDTVILERPLRGVPPRSDPATAVLAGRLPGLIQPVFVYRLPHAAPRVLFAETILPVPHLNAARKLFLAPAFDPERQVILPGGEDAVAPSPADLAARARKRRPGAPAGRVRVLSRGPERVDLAVDSPVRGVVVLQRAQLPLWRATVDGAPAAVEPANLYRIGVRVPAGSHRLRLWVDRRPLWLSSAVAGLGLIGLAALCLLVAPAERSAGAIAADGADGADGADTISAS